MTRRSSAMLAAMTVAMLLLGGASFVAAGDRVLGAVLIAFATLRAALALRDAYRKTDDT